MSNTAVKVILIKAFLELVADLIADLDDANVSDEDLDMLEALTEAAKERLISKIDEQIEE